MADYPATQLVRVADEVLRTLEQAGIRACLIGGMVISRWGQPRATTDADFSALAPYGDEGRVLDVLLDRFEARRVDARDFALKKGTRLDVGLVRRWGREFAELKEDPDLLRPFEASWRKVHLP